MAILSITIPNTDAPDVLAAMEQRWIGVATNQSFGGDPNAYAAATAVQRGQALLRAYLTVTTRDYRLQVAQQAVAQPPDVAIS